jgi:hypothetical protein
MDTLLASYQIFIYTFHFVTIFYETAEIISINPLIPQDWGTPPGRNYPAPLFQRSL